MKFYESKIRGHLRTGQGQLGCVCSRFAGLHHDGQDAGRYRAQHPGNDRGTFENALGVWRSGSHPTSDVEIGAAVRGLISLSARTPCKLEAMGQTIRTALLRNVFDGRRGREFNGKLARVCVLFEDLRIELQGLSEFSLSVLDILDPEKENWLAPELTGKYRKFYFTRRSIATLREFAECLRLIVQDMAAHPTLRLTFRGLQYEESKSAWEAAIQFFDTNKDLVTQIRNDIGGHFGHKAALNALSLLSSDVCGSIAFGDDDQKLRLHFAGEIAATALLKHLPGKDVAEYTTLIQTCIGPGYEHAINCVYILVQEYLWERFGS